ncbi:E3 ubiquitin/ISG15 ligase TRIM25-like [Bufo gargarizans]|uniref:E3 ubiquitin/ISG15 ligase TRIM25-like n=1 Tax=Bufo gargarizans TaxID=30331 RepID=UPI001CF1557B|nr:E3 ubiquitin/ISG15 ligase TRIM25-like [Bufo gargarizans]
MTPSDDVETYLAVFEKVAEVHFHFLLTTMASVDLRDELICSICLNIYTDPVTLSCGHNFCRGCINGVLDIQGNHEGYSCPDCRARFTGHPVLQGNVTLRNIAERFQSAEPEGNSGVLCRYCIHTPVPAVKCCLHCEASLCPDHLRVHSKSPEHILCEPGIALNTRKCVVHKKILEYYCSEDSTLICVSCRLQGEHGGHQVESLDKASEKKRSQLFKILQQLESKISEMKKNVQSLEERKRNIHYKATRTTKDISAMFGDIRRQLEDLEKRVLMEVSRQEEQALLTASDLIRQLEMKKDGISASMRHTEALCHMTDPVAVLQDHGPKVHSDVTSEKGPTAKRMREDGNVADDLCMDPISNALHALNDIVRGARRGIYMPPPTDILLDVDTAGDYINISDDLKVAAYSERKNDLPKTPGRFKCNQILSRQSFSSGVHYWDMEGSGSGMWRVGVCYPSIDRAQTNSVIGSNDRSWALEYFISEYSAIHDSEEVSVFQDTSCQRLRIWLDYEAGQLSFYELSDPIKHLHTFSAIFTEPLHAAFWVGWDTVYKDSWVKIEDCGK